MADSLASLLPRLRPLVPDLLSRVRLDVVVGPDGVLHAQRSNYLGCARTGPGTTARAVALAELRPSTTCDSCLRPRWLTSVLRGMAGALLEGVLDLTHQQRRSDAVTGSARAILRQRDAHLAAHEALTGVLPQARALLLPTLEPLLSDADAERLDELLVSSQDSLDRLTRLLRSPVERAAVLDEVRHALVGALGAEEYALDETPTLVGIHPYDAPQWTQRVHALVEQCSLRRSPMVLVVPRYAADHLLREAGSNASLRPPAGAGDLDDSQLDTAARLWQPSVEGPMSSLVTATAAAQALGGADA